MKILGTALSNTGSLNIYPNPTNGILYVEMKNFSTSEYYLKVVDLLGNVVHQSRVSTVNSQINLQDLSNGIYNVLIGNDDKTLERKIVILK